MRCRGEETCALYPSSSSHLESRVCSPLPRSLRLPCRIRQPLDDALHATRAAVEEGIVPGGGVALLRAAKRLGKIETANEDQKTGINIVRKALSWPARLIAINAGADGSIVVGKILENSEYGFGYNAQSGEYGDLMSQGVIDPTKVVRSALQGAASIAGLLITTEAMVAERPKKEAAHAPMPGGGMGGMDY